MELRYDSSKEAAPIVTNTFVPPVVTPPPVWARVPPNILSIKFDNGYDSVLKAKFLDGSPGHDGLGTAIHYGDISGDVDSWNPFVIDSKFSNPTSPPQWLTDLDGRKFLRSSTAGCAKEPQPQVGCRTCRLMLFNVLRIIPRVRMYLAWSMRFGKKTWDGQTDIGIKLPGIMGEELELGPKVPTGWPLQWYRYDAEGSMIVTPIPGVIIPWDQWVRFEVMVESNTATSGVPNHDGAMAARVNGATVYSRKDVMMGKTMIDGALYQTYHGGQLCPGPLEVDTSSFELSYADWIGPEQ